MSFTVHHKALFATLLFIGAVIFAIHSIHLTKQNEMVADIFIEIESKTEKELQQEFSKAVDLNKPASNNAYNEDKAFKAIMKKFKMVPQNDFEKTIKTRASRPNTTENKSSTRTTYTNHKTYAIKQSEKQTFNSLKEVASKTSNETPAVQHAKTKSTLTYALKNRTLLSYDTPRYLCERSGKIVITIVVNKKGKVTDAYINGASNSSNGCLIDQAIAYAKSVRFNASNFDNQKGTITYYFKGKG